MCILWEQFLPEFLFGHELWQQLTRQCFELEQIRDHFYYRNGQFFYCKCGLGFALAQSIAELIAATVHVGVCVCDTEQFPGRIAPIKYSNSLL